jgi:hypothetical protein
LPFDSIFLISFFFSFLCYRPIYFWNRLFFKIWSTIVNSPLGEKTSFLRYWKRERKISWLWSTLLFFFFLVWWNCWDQKRKNSHQNFKEKEGRTNGGLSKSIVVE